MVVNLAPLDLLVIGLFLATLLALGFSAKLRNNSILQFLAAGRSLTLPVFVATLVSTWYGGILGVGESVSFFGLGTFVLLGVPYYVFALVYAYFFAERVRGGEQLSIPERLGDRYGKSVALLGAVLIFMLGVPAAHVLMLGVLVESITGWSPVLSIVVGTGIGVAFLYRGGLLADARVSLLAFVMMYIGFGVIVAWCLAHYPLLETWMSVEPEKLKWDGGQGILYVISFFILGAWTLIDPAFHQRVASTDSPATGKKGVLISTGFWFLFDLLTITTGMYAWALLTNKPTNGLLLFPAFGDVVLPAGLKAVFLCGMLGTITTAMVGYTLVSGATIGREVVARLKPQLSDSQITQWTRLGIVIACLVAILLAMQIQSVVNLWYQWGGVTIGALLLPVALAYGIGRGSRVSKNVIFLSMILAAGGSLAWMIYGIRTGNAYLTVNIAGSSFSVGTLLPGLAVSALVIGAGEAAARLRRNDQ